MRVESDVSFFPALAGDAANGSIFGFANGSIAVASISPLGVSLAESVGGITWLESSAAFAFSSAPVAPSSEPNAGNGFPEPAKSSAL